MVAFSAGSNRPLTKTAKLLMREFAVQPKECMIVGDGQPDLELGKAAGIFTVGCTWGTNSREILETFGVDTIIDSIDDLGPMIESLLTNRLMGYSISEKCQ